MAFAATRQVGSSVDRHRHIRKLREFYRLNKGLFGADSHYLLLVRAPLGEWGEFEERLKALLAALG